MIKNGKKPTRVRSNPCRSLEDDESHRSLQRKPEDVLASSAPSGPAAQKPRRRRVPITVVDPVSAPISSSVQPDVTFSSNLLAPVSTRKLIPLELTSTSPPRPPPASPPSSSTAVRPGGGIFRRDGSHQVFGAKDEQRPDNGSSDAPPLNVDILPKDFAELSVKATQSVPTSMYAFDRNWMALRTPQARWAYLQVGLKSAKAVQT